MTDTDTEMTQTSGDAPRDQPPAPKSAAPAVGKITLSEKSDAVRPVDVTAREQIVINNPPKPAAPAVRKPPPKKKPAPKAAPAPEKVPGIVLRVAADLVVRYTPLGRGRWRIESEAAMQEVEVGGGIVGAHDGTYIEIGELHWNTWGHPEIMDPPVAPRIAGAPGAGGGA